jgi:hypothetical protein
MKSRILVYGNILYASIQKRKVYEEQIPYTSKLLSGLLWSHILSGMMVLVTI